MGRDLFIHLHDSLRARAQAGQVNVFNQLAKALPDWTLHFQPDTRLARLGSVLRGGYGLYHMQPPPRGGRILCLRRAYMYPFWRIERTNLRWEFDVARATFDPDTVHATDAQTFAERWRKTLFKDHTIQRSGFILIPLQGQLQSCRSFQSCTPLHMIEETLARDPRPIRATLHPGEVYSPADLNALDTLSRRFPRFEVASAQTTALLAACDLVVTQNSAVALTGFFAQKPAILFADSDFHHIAASVPRVGLSRAFAAKAPENTIFPRYLHWFFREQAINAGAPDAACQLNARLRVLGWPAPILPR